MTEKKFETYGIASGNFKSLNEALAHSKIQDKLVKSPIVFPQNPFNQHILESNNILEIGCGTGRNLEWILNNTKATYIGLDPNISMLNYFWEQNCGYNYMNKRIHITSDIYNSILQSKKYDVILSTFVFQHIAYNPTENIMNIDDITQIILRFTNKETVWFLIEHEGEQKDGWFDRWINNNKFTLHKKLG